MKAKLTKLFTLLTILTLGITNVWAAGTALADLNFSGITAAPSAYTYSSSNTPSYNASQGPSGDKRSCMLVGNGGKGQTPTIESTGPITSEGKRWMAFCPAEDCDLEIVCTGNGKIFKLYDKDHYNALTNVDATTSHLSSFTGTSSWETWEITGLKAGTWYVLSATSSSSYVTSMTFTAASSTPVCPSGLSITSKNDKTAFMEGDAIELTAALTAGNGDISYQWYKGGTAEGNKLTGKTTNKLQIASCTTADEGSYYCVASKTSCADAVNASAFAITVAADTKCFNMPAITSKPSDLASVTVTGGTLSDVSTAKAVAMNANGLKLDGNSVYLKVTLTNASIVEGTKITVAWKGAGSGAGIAVVNGDLAEKVIDETGVEAAGSATHTFTAAEAANYADEFIIHRNASGTGIYVNAITVEDCGPAIVKHTVTLNYNDGETPAGSLTVVDGNAAVKPADPTRGKYTFLGWFVGDTDNEYVWSTAVTDDITLKAHWQDPWTITFDADGGSAVADVTVKHNTKAEKPADPTKDDNDFMGWFYGDPAVAFDWDANVTQNYALVAHWQAAVAKYDIEYYDGETKIGTEEQVWATAHPTAAGIETAKPLYTFVGWFTSSTLEGDPVALNTVTPIEGLKLYGKWAKAFATSVDLEGLVEASGTGADWQKYLSDHGYAFSTSNVSLDEKKDPSENKPYDNWPYQGLKAKVSGAYVEGNIEAGKLVIIKLGHMAADATVTIDGVAQDNASGLDAAEPAGAMNYYYLASEGLLHYETTNAGACILKAITITDPFTVSFDANGGDPVAAQDGEPSVTLPSATKGTESFLGWFDADDNKIGEAGETYTPTADITLHAQWETVSTDARLASITFSSDAGTLAPAFDPEVTEYTYTMPYGTAAIPTITGGTAVNANAQTPIIGDAAAAWGDAQTIKGVAQSNDKKTYTITMKVAPKDGVCLVWADVSADNTLTYNATNSKFYAESDVTLQNSNVKGKDGSAPSGKKFQTNGFLKIALNEGTFLAGDVVALNVTYGTANVMHVFKAQAATSTDVIGEATGNTDAGLNKVAITEDAATLWLVRGGDYGDWNPHVDYVAVYRAMNPILTAITINGETGTINESAKTVAVELQPGYDLAALTIVPTIVSNTAEASVVKTVESNGGAWVIGDNTYRLTDKDGDYTEYTVTLTAGELKHNVSFNTHGGSTIDPVQVVDGQKLAAAPADPTKDDYIFQGWAETEDGSIVDVTSFTISADKEFHAVWAADGAIKLIEAGVINTTNFVTGGTLSSGTISVDEVDYKYITLAGTNGEIGSASNVTTDRFVMYHATTTKTKIQIHAYANGNARQVRLSGLVEGASTLGLQQTINVAKNDDELTEYFSFDSDKHRTFYITIPSSASDVYLLQVKVIESGEPLAAIGTAGTSFNFNKGRLFAPQSVATSFDGIDIKTYNKYAALSTEYAELSDGAISFYVPNDVCLSVASNANGTNKYYVTNEVTGTDNETTTANAEFNLTGGKTWYIRLADSSKRVRFTNIAFSQPTCPEAVLPSFVGAYCEGGSIPTLDATATNDLTDYNVVYSWFAADAPETELANVATFTPATDGDYKVKVTVSKAGYLDAVVISDAITVAVTPAIAITMDNLSAHASDAVALTVNVTAGVPTAYAWYTCDDELGTNPVLIAAAEAASYNIPTPVVEQYYKVVVSGVCGGDVTAVAHVTLLPDYTRVDVTESTTWDWTKASEETTVNMPEVNVETLLANVPGIHNDANFNSQALLVTGQYAKRDGGSNIAFQGTTVRFYVTKPGKVTITARRASGSGSMDVSLNGTVVLDDLTSTKKTSKAIFVPAGWVTIEESDNNNQMRLYEIVYNATPDYKRDASIGDDWMAPGELGTVCIPNGAVATGGDLYELVGKNDIGKIVFATVPNNKMTPGVPYLFQATSNAMNFFYTDEATAENPVNTGAMKGTFSLLELTGDELKNVYYFAGHALWGCEDLITNGEKLTVAANRAYVVLDNNVPTANTSNPAPGRRYITMEAYGQNAATGIGNVQGDNAQWTKVLINGQLYILRGEKMYDATGRMVK